MEIQANLKRPGSSYCEVSCKPVSHGARGGEAPRLAVPLDTQYLVLQPIYVLLDSKHQDRWI
jgi:hypothetical protein